MISYILIFTPSETVHKERDTNICEVFKASFKFISTCAINHCKKLCSGFSLVPYNCSLSLSLQLHDFSRTTKWLQIHARQTKSSIKQYLKDQRKVLAI